MATRVFVDDVTDELPAPVALAPRDLAGLAEELAAASGSEGLSIIVSDANAGARRLYERCGYCLAAERTMVKKGWANAGVNWLLLLKPRPAIGESAPWASSPA